MLNISHNSISNLAGLQHCTTLSTLICSRNSLTDYSSMNALSYCKELSTVDLQDNKLDSDAVSPTRVVPAPVAVILHLTHSISRTHQAPSQPTFDRHCLCTLPKAECILAWHISCTWACSGRRLMLAALHIML